MVAKHEGFTLVELIAVIVILSVISVTAMSRFLGNDENQLQASRDSIVAALLSAQQLAMAQTDLVQVAISGSSVDVRRDTGTGFMSINAGGVQYPVNVAPVVATGTIILDYDRLGQTSATTIILTHGMASASIEVSASGFSQ